MKMEYNTEENSLILILLSCKLLIATVETGSSQNATNDIITNSTFDKHCP